MISSNEKKQTDSHADGETGHENRRTGKQTDSQTGHSDQTDGQTERQADRQTDRMTGRVTDRRIDISKRFSFKLRYMTELEDNHPVRCIVVMTWQIRYIQRHRKESDYG